MGDRDPVERWLVGLESPSELLLEALRCDLRFYEELEALDRVPETGLPLIAEAVARHLPSRVADEIGQHLLLQAPELMGECADRLSDPAPYPWRQECWDADRSLLILPAHHVAFPEDAVEVRTPDGFASLTTPSPTWRPGAPAVGTGRVGGAAEGRCLACGRQLRRLLDLESFSGAEGVALPGKIVACARFSCLWGEQFFTHDAEVPRSLPRQDDFPPSDDPAPQEVPELEVTFHPAPARWQVQDWALSNDRQNLNRLGGPASWVQDAFHPDCARCTRPMPFLAQLDGATRFRDGPGWEAWTEGMIYVFWCSGCRVSAVCTQQT